MDFVFSPSRSLRDRYSVCRSVDGFEVVSSSRVPLHAAARWCEDRGISGRVRLFRPGSAVPAMSAGIGWAAARTVVETATLGPVVRRSRPFLDPRLPVGRR